MRKITLILSQIRIAAAVWFGVVSFLSPWILMLVTMSDLKSLDITLMLSISVLGAIFGGFAGYFHAYKIFLLNLSIRSIFKTFWIGFLWSTLIFFIIASIFIIAGEIHSAFFTTHYADMPDPYPKLSLLQKIFYLPMASLMAYIVFGWIISIIGMLASLVFYCAGRIVGGGKNLSR